MRNVLFVVNYKGASEGSFMRALTALGEEIEREGNKEVYLLPNKCKKYDWAKKLVAGGDSVYYFSDSISGFLKTVRTIKKIIKSFKVEIIHSFFMTARLHLAVALACSLAFKFTFDTRLFVCFVFTQVAYDAIFLTFTFKTL